MGRGLDGFDTPFLALCSFEGLRESFVDRTAC